MKKFITLMMICIVLMGVLGSPVYGYLPDPQEMSILSLIPKELLIIAIVIYCIGMFFKASKKVPDWTIPFVLLGCSVIITIAYMAVSLGQGFTQKVLVDGLVYGILIATVAVFANQAWKQATIERLKE